MKCVIPLILPSLVAGFGQDGHQLPIIRQIALLSEGQAGGKSLIQSVLQNDPNEVDIVRHQKEAGEGYVKGSPLFAKQEGTDGEEAEAEKKAQFSKGDTLPISTAVKCILNLLIQYFVLYTALAIVRTVNQIQGNGPTKLERICTNATRSVNYAPMLCALFLGTRMRAIQLTQGDTEKYKLPQPWAQNGMQCAAWAVLAKAIISIILGIMGHEEEASDEEALRMKKPKTHEGSMNIVLEFIQYLTMAALYGGFITVVVGAIIMPAPKEIWGDNAPPVSPAVNNTINLGAQYFIVILILEIFTTMARLSEVTETKNVGVWSLAAETVQIAPMLCVMFLAVRQRALQMDPKNGNPQKWAQNCMFICSYSVLIQTLLVILISYGGGECKRKPGAMEGDVTFEVSNPTLTTILGAIRWLLMAGLYVSSIIIAVSPFVLTMEGIPDLPIAPALCNVLILVAQYFFVYLGLWLSISYAQASNNDLPKQIFRGAKQTVMYAPMLAILFVAARMRSQQIAQLGGVEGAPQTYAQDGMHLATWSLLIQVIMVIIIGIVSGGVKVDSEGNVVTEGGSVWHKLVEVIRYVCLLSLYGGVIAILVGIFQMDVETVNLANRGPGGLIPGVTIPAAGSIAQGEGSGF